tara:strand:- start:1162 stop:1365 length:204 start_codon:yes stop_codon:yes gene_type:complete
MSIPAVLPLTLEFLGTLLIGLSVLRVHTHLSKEKKIDKHIINDIRKEKKWTFIGLILIAIGFILNFF